ncbi:hypothetical protein AB1Y20_017621 [Prymnesium parvum]|uniref:Carboxylic ester hydrolase n=1 Tax=Prymnesium parvum TaxID=97485 RepID=A0AB34JN88_PRYPA
MISALALLPLGQNTPALSFTAGGIPVIANTTNGFVEGRYDRDQRSLLFFGIPFANSTAGDNRFKGPQPVTPWFGSTLTTITTAHCTQINPNPATGNGQQYGSEDCLKLDVIAPNGGSPAIPAPAAAATYPVQCWFYGGGFAIESFPLYQYKHNMYSAGDETNLAYLPNNGKVVTVFGRYRVGYLGFASHPSLKLTSGSGYSGNWGILDAIQTLKWIQSNIGYFGGDSDAVTIQGESAGATLTGILVSSPLCYPPAVPKNLFRAAISQSLWPVAGYGATYSTYVNYEMADYLVGALGCSGYASSLSATNSELLTIATCLRAATALAVQSASGDSVEFNRLHGENSWEFISYQATAYPTIDGYVLPKSPRRLWVEDGMGASVHWMIGNNADEYALFLGGSVLDPYSFNLYAGYHWCIWSQPEMNETVTLGRFAQHCGNDFPGVSGFVGTGFSDKIRSVYGSVVDSFQQDVQWTSDAYFAVNHQVIFDLMSAQPARTPGTLFKFVYAQPNTGPTDFAPFLGAPHTIELNYIWGYHLMGKNYLTDNIALAGGEFSYTDQEIALGLTMKKYWANFFHTGYPSHASDGLPTWQPMTATESHTMVFKAGAPGGFGAIQSPCVQFTSCITETTGSWRRGAHELWTSGLTTSPSLTTCSAPVVGYSHTSTYQFASNCTYNPCCSTRRRTRSLLFGSPGTSDDADCDSFC